MVDEEKQVNEITKMLMDVPGAVTYQPNAYELPTHDPYKTKVAVSSNNGELTIDYNKLANAVHKYSYIKTKETAMDILQKIAYESEYAYCNRDTKWFERICKEYNIDINLFY